MNLVSASSRRRSLDKEGRAIMAGVCQSIAHVMVAVYLQHAGKVETRQLQRKKLRLTLNPVKDALQVRFVLTVISQNKWTLFVSIAQRGM